MTDARTEQHRRRNATALQAIERNPLDAEDHAMIAMFDREGLSGDQRRRYIIKSRSTSRPGGTYF